MKFNILFLIRAHIESNVYGRGRYRFLSMSMASMNKALDVDMVGGLGEAEPKVYVWNAWNINGTLKEAAFIGIFLSLKWSEAEASDPPKQGQVRVMRKYL